MDYKSELRREILAEEASLCPVPWQFRFVTKDTNGFHWKEKNVNDESLTLEELITLHTLVFRRKELYT